MSDLTQVNEGVDVFLDLTFLDADGEPDIPDSARYRIDDETTGQVVVDWQDIEDIAGSSITVTLPAGSSKIIRQEHHKEVRRVIIEAPGFRAQARFEVYNLREPLDLSVVISEDYTEAGSGRFFDFTGGYGWPDLSGITPVFEAYRGHSSFSPGEGSSITVVETTDSAKQVRLELSSDDTASLTAGEWRYALFSDSSKTFVLDSGKMIVSRPY